jgi:putative PIN family toxin of toxin-antitoxin system
MRCEWKNTQVKAVVDTNTLISGSLWQGACAQFLDAASHGKVELVLSPKLLAEFAQVVARPKFAARVAARGATANDLARKLAEEVTIVSPSALPLPAELRDPKDLHVLECAVAAQADAIVSGDQDLLSLRSFQGIPIMNASKALRQVESEGE